MLFLRYTPLSVSEQNQGLHETLNPMHDFGYYLKHFMCQIYDL